MQNRVLPASFFNPPSRLGSAVERLQAAGLRATASRVHVLLAVEAAPAPLTAEDLFGALADQGVNIGLGTTYRALSELAGVGLLARTWLPGHARAKAVYAAPAAARADGTCMHRLTCRHCGRSLPFFDASLQERLSQATGLQALNGPGQSLTISMDCAACEPAVPAGPRRGRVGMGVRRGRQRIG